MSDTSDTSDTSDASDTSDTSTHTNTHYYVMCTPTHSRHSLKEWQSANQFSQHKNEGYTRTRYII
jgi:hypothetical protein